MVYVLASASRKITGDSKAVVAVQGAHDMYKAGEYAVCGGVLYRCISDTAYSPEEYAAAWGEAEK